MPLVKPQTVEPGLVLEVYNKLQERKDRSGPAREFDRTLFGDTETDL